jgi:hypothetical protein
VDILIMIGIQTLMWVGLTENNIYSTIINMK